MTSDDRHHVVVIGGGFGGLSAARRLTGGPVRVTLIDQRGVHLFQPLLYQVATGLLSEGQISAPLRTVLRRHSDITCLTATVVGIDLAARTVQAGAADDRSLTVPYDSLVVATGVEVSWFGHDDFAEHSTPMKTLDDALQVRRRVFSAFEAAEALTDDRDAERRRAWLTFALVGAGPTGVELAGQLRELATRTLAEEFRSIDPAHARVVLLDAGDRAVASFSPAMSRSAERTLSRLGVELVLGTQVTSVGPDGVHGVGRDGQDVFVPARTVLWTAGVAAGPLAATLVDQVGADPGRGGRVPVQPDLTLPGHPEVFVVGDAAALDDLPGVAEVAMQGGRFAATRILDRLADGSAHERHGFRYRDLGSAAYVSRGHALVEAGPLRLTGMLGWFAWGAVHLAFLTGFRNRAGAMLTWTTTLATGRRRERTFVRAPA